MKVYSVELHIQYEGTTTMGIFSTREKAESVAEACQKDLEEFLTDHWYSVHKWEVDPDDTTLL